jgi:protocatechuate 3,4-dioxygenase beta subunit
MAILFSQGGNTVFKAMRTFRHLGSLVLLALVTPLLFGCGGGGSPAFEDIPVVSLGSGAEATVAPGGSRELSIILDKPAPRSITVGIVNSGNADEFSVPVSVDVSKGQSSARFTVTALTTAEGASMEVRLTAGSGYSVGTPASMAVSVAATGLPEVRLGGGNTTLSPGSSTVYAVLVDQQVSEDLTVELLTVGDSGQFAVPANVTIPAGATAANFTVTASNAALLGASVELSILAGSRYTVGAPSSTTVTIGAGLAPQVRLGGGNTTLSPGASTSYTLLLNQPAPADLSINLSGGGVTSGFSFPSVVTINAGASAANFTVSASASALLGSTLQLSIVAGSGYTVGTPATATVTVGAGLAPQVTLGGGNTTLSPGASTSYTLLLNQPAPADLSINLSGGGVTSGFSFPSVVTINAGASAANFTVSASASALLGSTLQLSIVAGSGYTVGTPATATVTVGAGLAPQVTLGGENSILFPGASTRYSVILNQSAPTPLTIRLAASGVTGSFSLPTTVTVPAGQSSASFTVSASTDALLGASIQIAIVAGAGYTVGTPATGTVTVGAGTAPEVIISGGNRNLAPGESTSYALILNQPAQQTISVNLAVAGDTADFTYPSAVTIQAGRTSANFTVTAGPNVNGKSIVINVVAGVGYTVGPQASVNVTGVATGAGSATEVFQGTGASVIAFTVPVAGIVTFELTHTGTGVFLVDLLDSNAEFIKALVIGSGDLTATRIENLAQGSYFLDIQTAGTWTVQITYPSQGTDPQPLPVASVITLASSPQLPSVGEPPVTLTAFVRNSSNVLMEGVSVSFAADNDGTLLVTRGVTDASGSAQAELSTVGNKSNRVITVTATAGGQSGSVEVRVVGTNISIAGRNSGLIGEQITLTLTLRDSAGNPIPGVPLSVEFPGGDILTSPNPVTAANGQAEVTVGLTGSGEHVLTVTGFGAVATFTISVSPDSLVFLEPEPPPAPRTEVALNTLQTVTVELKIADVPAAGEQINFSATRGVLVPTTALTGPDGRATVQVSADNAGPSIITATVASGAALGTTAQLEILFVATIADSMTLQANPAVIGTNLPGDTDEQSEIIAVVRDPDGNLVKNKTINFNLTDITGGSLSPSSAVTDVFGRATTTYTAGSTSSAQNGIQIYAEVADTPTVNETVFLTTAQKSLFITLGTGDTIRKDLVRYFKPYGVLVTDSSGNPVANAQVTIEIWPTAYYKGEYPDPGPPWIWTPSAGPCLNEDVNRDGILNPGEDFNSNLQLDPGNVVTLSTGTLTTDASGFADFEIVYFQQFADWVEVELTARATVAGSESTEQVFFRLPILFSDTTSAAGPAGNPSPFGTGNFCGDTN